MKTNHHAIIKKNINKRWVHIPDCKHWELTSDDIFKLTNTSTSNVWGYVCIAISSYALYNYLNNIIFSWLHSTFDMQLVWVSTDFKQEAVS